VSEKTDKIIKACIGRNASAQMQFYAMFCKTVYNSCYRILLQAEEAEDAMQEAFVKAFDRLETMGEAAPEAWLRRIAVNTAIDKLKRRRPVRTGIEEFAAIADGEPYDEEEISLKVAEVRRAIDCLPDDCRVIISLHLLDGFDFGEVAEILHIREDAARKRFERARKRLVASLAGCRRDDGKHGAKPNSFKMITNDTAP
jgi:RNA polymerase sigma-70 factor (ECF subfamily)